MFIFKSRNGTPGTECSGHFLVKIRNFFWKKICKKKILIPGTEQKVEIKQRNGTFQKITFLLKPGIWSGGRQIPEGGQTQNQIVLYQV
jgi:hypothetical protein